MTRGAETAERLVAAALGAMWLVSAASKAIDPEAAYELVARVAGGGFPAKAVVVVTTAVEALLGGAMLFGAVRGFLATLAVLVPATGLLFAVRAISGGTVRCGCMALLADSNVDEAIRRNAVIAGVAIAAGVGFSLARRAGRRAAAASGPATPAP